MVGSFGKGSFWWVPLGKEFFGKEFYGRVILALFPMTSTHMYYYYIRILFIIFSPIRLEKGDRRAAARVQDSFSVLLLIRRDLQKHLALQLGQHNQNLYNDMKYVLEFFLYVNRNMVV